MALHGGMVYVALGNYDAAYNFRGPGLLAVLNPQTGQQSVIDLGGTSHHDCISAYTVREGSGKIYVTCSGDFHDGSGRAIVEVDPSAGKVTRTVKLTTQPSGIAFGPSRLWFGDAYTGGVYAIDLSTFTAATAQSLPIACPTTGTYQTTNDIMAIQGDLYAACSNDTGGILSRLDANTGAVKMHVASGPTAVAFTETSDGRIAILSGADSKLRLVTIGPSALSVSEAYTFSGTQTMQDVRSSGHFLFTTSSGTDTVQRLDLTKTGAQMLVGEASMGTGAVPYTILPLDDDQALVANQTANTVVSVGSDCSAGRACWAVPK
jgi:hypothetical protein